MQAAQVAQKPTARYCEVALEGHHKTPNRVEMLLGRLAALARHWDMRVSPLSRIEALSALFGKY
jgi:hypothetical protein